MWSYYGSKSKIVQYYPKPKFNKVIEPFAGSARYSLQHFENDILLIDKYPVVVKLWQWLQQCSENDILSLPQLKKGDKLSDLNLCEEERIFLGFMAGIASISPRNTVSEFASIQFARGNKLKKVADQLYKIKHWQIQLGSYEELPNQDATWFIDPPYQFGGSSYVEGKIDFCHLSEWAKSRTGQVVVCENTKATWMDFHPLIKMRGAMSETTEAVWYNNPKSYRKQQISLFSSAILA